MVGHKAPDKPVAKIISHWGEEEGGGSLEFSLVIALPLRDTNGINDICSKLDTLARRAIKAIPKTSLALSLQESMGAGPTEIARMLDDRPGKRTRKSANDFPEIAGKERVKKEIRRARAKGRIRMGAHFECPALDCIGEEILPPDKPIPKLGKRLPFHLETREGRESFYAYLDITKAN